MIFGGPKVADITVEHRVPIAADKPGEYRKLGHIIRIQEVTK